MADIAKIGFSVDTSELADGKVKLDALAPAAARAEKAADKLEKSMGEASVAAGKLSSELNKNKAATSASVSASNNAAAAATAAATATGKHGAAAATAAGSIQRQGAASASAANSARNQATASNSAAAASRNHAAAAAAASTQVQQLNAQTARVATSMTGAVTPVGNLAAQFQDIGVTAAMGMSPMQIALQQGTQISAVFGGMGAAAAVRSLGEAFASIISPVSLATIALVGLAAAGFQMVDWTGLAKSALHGLADILPVIAPYALAAGAALLLIYSPAIVSGVVALTKAIYGLAVSLLSLIPIPVLIVAGLVAIVAAANYFRDDLTQILGVDIVKVAKDAINFIVGGFVGGYNAVQATWKQLPAAVGDAAIQAANRVIAAMTRMVNSGIDGINSMLAGLPSWLGLSGGIQARVAFNPMDNPYAGSAEGVAGVASGKIKEAQSVDYVGKGLKFINDQANRAANALRNFADGLGKDGKKKPGKKASDKAGGGKTEAEKFSDIVAGADRDIATLKAEIAGVNLSAEAAARLKNEQKLLNEAQQKGITLSDAQRAKLMQLAGTITDLQMELANLKGFKEITDGAAQTLATLQAEGAAIGLVGQAAAVAKYEQELLNQAKAKGITLSAAQTAALKQEAAALATQATANDSAKYVSGAIAQHGERMANLYTEIEAIGLSAEAAANLTFQRKLMNDEQYRGIMISPQERAQLIENAAAYNKLAAEVKRAQDMMEFKKDITKGFIDDLRSGLEQGKSLWETFGNMVVNVLNRIIDKMLEAAIAGFFEGGTGGGMGGLLGSGNAIGTFLTSLFSAKGNTFTSQGVTAFASGGAFTNSVVSRTTPFTFGKGAALGVMGEAGPEAIMPLERGPDGSLGVQMYGGRGGGNRVTNNTVEVNNQYTLSGAVSSEDIIALNRQGAEKTKEEVKRKMMGWLNEYQRDGTITS